MDRNVSGIRNAEMKWANPERLDTYGVRLIGWPSDIPARNPSSLKQGQNKQLMQYLDNGTLRFEKLLETPSQDHMLEGATEESPVFEEDFSWAYDADAEIGQNTAVSVFGRFVRRKACLTAGARTSRGRR